MTTEITPEMLRVGAEARIRELETKFAEKESEARSLARELKDRVAELEAALDRYTRLSESGESLGGELDEREKRMELEAKLAESAKQFVDMKAYADHVDIKLAAAEKDAKRYRALFEVPASINMPVLRPPFHEDPKGEMAYSNKKAADTAIDKAMESDG